MTLVVDDVVVRRGNFIVRATFACRSGETVALLGPNGAGKSSLVGALAGVEPVESGRVELDGIVLDDPSTAKHVAERRRPVGVVYQDLALFPHLSAVENV